MYIMAVVIGCGLVAGLIYYKKNSIIRSMLEKYSDYRECQKQGEEKKREQEFKDVPKDKLISCKYYDFVPNIFMYDRTVEKHVSNSKICKLKFKDKEFYSFLKNYDLKNTYFEYLDKLEDTDSITHLNKITKCIPQLLSATATIKIKSHNMDLEPEFDIIEFINKFNFNGNSLYLTDANKIYLIALLNAEYSLSLDISTFFLDGNVSNNDPDNLDLEVLYQLITNDAEIYIGTNLVLNFDENCDLKVTTKFKEL